MMTFSSAPLAQLLPWPPKYGCSERFAAGPLVSLQPPRTDLASSGEKVLLSLTSKHPVDCWRSVRFELVPHSQETTAASYQSLTVLPTCSVPSKGCSLLMEEWAPLHMAVPTLASCGWEERGTEGTAGQVDKPLGSSEQGSATFFLDFHSHCNVFFPLSFLYLPAYQSPIFIKLEYICHV